MAGKGSSTSTRAVSSPLANTANEIDLALKKSAGSLHSVLEWQHELVQVRIHKGRDGVIWAIAKRQEVEGRVLAAFGSGYDAFLAMAALNAAIQAGRWSVDKPYVPKGE